MLSLLFLLKAKSLYLDFNFGGENKMQRVMIIFDLDSDITDNKSSFKHSLKTNLKKGNNSN